MTRNENGKFDFFLNWKFLLVSGGILLAVMALVTSFRPWTWDHIEKIRLFMHRDMNMEVFQYYSSKIRTLFSLFFFISLCLITAALTVRFVPHRIRLKIFPVLADEKYAGYFGGILIFIFAAGVFLRLECYLFHNFWGDTLALADAVHQLPFQKLLTTTLPNAQSAPPFFLLTAKIFGEVFGYNELALGFPALAAGIFSLYVFTRLMRRSFQPPVVLLMVFLFAFNSSLIFYSAEFKQYSFDVLVTVLMLDCCLILLREPTLSRFIKTALSGIAGVLFSHAAFFVIPPLGAVLFFHSFCVKNKKNVLPMIVLVLVLALAVSGAALLALRVMPSSMYSYHADFFAPVPHDQETVRWYLILLLNIFRFPLGLSYPVLLLVLIPFAAIAAGIVHLWKNDRWILAGTGLPVVLMLTASLLKYYPIHSGDCLVFSRLILFTVPLLYFLLAAGLEHFYLTRKRLFYGIGLCCLVFSSLLFLTVFYFQWNLKPLYQVLQNNFRPGDKIYACRFSRWFIEFQNDRKEFDLRTIPVKNDSRLTELSKEDVAKWFPSPGRYWLFFSLNTELSEQFKSQLARHGTLTGWSAAGGTLYCLDRKP